MSKIYVSGDIDEAAFKEFCEQLDEFEDGVYPDSVEVVLNSIGGNALDAIAFASRIRVCPMDVNITVFGLAGSAAVLVLAAGDYRRMSKESWLMVHEDSGTYKNTKTSDIEREARNARQLEDQWSRLLEGFTGTSAEVWSDLHKRGDIYLTPKEGVTLGIVDEII